MQSDSKTDDFLDTASDLDEVKWFALSSLMAADPSSRPLTESEIADLLMKKSIARAEEVSELVEDLKQVGLLKRVVWEKRHEVLLGWRTSIPFGFV